MDVVSYALSKKVAASAVSGVKSMSVSGQTLTINTKDSGVLTMTFPVPKNGVSVTDIDVNAKNQIVFTMSDGTKITSGIIPTVKGDKGDKLTFDDLSDTEKESLKGTDGISPTATVTKIGNKTTITIIDKDGTTTADILDGTGGQGASTWSEVADKPFETLSTDFAVSENGELSVVGGSGSGEENIIEEIKINGVVQTPVDKSVDITIPDTADFVTNDELDAKGYLTQHQDLTNYAKKTDIPSVDNFVEKETGKSLIADTEIIRLASVDSYDDSAVTKRIQDIEVDYIKSTDLSTVATSGSYNDLTDKPTIPDEYDDTDVKNDITSVSDRVTAIEGDYATKTYVGEQIANAEHLKREIVTEIPDASTADDHTIYMLKVEDAVGNDKYREYMLIDGSIQCTGDTSVDLTGYAKTADLDSSIETLQNDKADKTEIPTTVAELTDASDYAKVESLTAHTDDADIHVTAELKEQYTDAVAKTHEHNNKDIIDKFTESVDGKPLYDGAEIISDNLWHGTKEEFDALTDDEKSDDITYVVTDEESSVADYFIDDSSTTTDKTWSSKKINKDFVSNTVSLQKLVPDGSDVADYVSSQGVTYLRYYTTTNSKVTNTPTDTANGYIWYCLDANLVITARNSKGEIWTNAILNGKPVGWKKMNSTTVKDVALTVLNAPKDDEIASDNHTITYIVKNGICYMSFLQIKFKNGGSATTDLNSFPKALVNNCWYVLTGVDDSSSSVLVSVSEDGVFMHHNNNINLTYSGSFSYPVAEN